MPQRGPRTHRSVQEWIRQKAADGWSAADVIRAGPPDGLLALWPSDRTIQALHKRLRPNSPRRTGDPWSLSPDSPPDIDPAVALAALRVLSTKATPPRRFLTVEEARWISLVARVLPNATVEAAIEATNLYLGMLERGLDTHDLDLWLAFGGPDSEPWWLWAPPTPASHDREED